MLPNPFEDFGSEEIAAAIGAGIVWHNLRRRWRDETTGGFIPEPDVLAEMRRHVEATFNPLQALTSSLYNGSINLQQWQISVANELKQAHLAQSMFAVGGKSNMTAVEYGRVGGVLADEYRHLSNFANDIANGVITEAQAQARIRQYGRATQQAYWREYAQASPEIIHWELHPAEHCDDCLSLAASSPYTADTLPTYPGAGETQCRGNCQCTLRREAA